MADFKLDRIRFRWKNSWTISTDYIKDDIVYYNGKAYVCLISHQSNGVNFETDLNAPSPKWELMFDGNRWAGSWQPTTFYSKGDIVKFNGYLYQCILSHTSNVLSTLGPPSDSENWTVVAEFYNWRNTWTVNTYYNLSDIVIYNGITYKCNTAHRSNVDSSLGLEIDQAKWDIVTRSDNWLDTWSTSTRYMVDDIIKYGAIVYRCIQGHTSSSNATDGLEVDQSKWEISIEGVEYLNEWTESYRYKKNDIVKYNHSLWICITGHTSGSNLRQDENNWNIWLPGLGYENLWDIGIEYEKGDIVLYGGYVYVALENNLGSIPSINGILQDTGDWELLKEGYRHRGDWNQNTAYLTGDVIRDKGYLYIATGDNTNDQPDLGNNWLLLVPGYQWLGEWNDNVTYNLGDVVTYESSSYYCIARHTSAASDSRPDIDIQQDDQDYWQPLILGTNTNVLTTRGDLRTHNGVETVRFAIDNPGKILKVHTEGTTIQWQNFEEVNNVFFVSTNGFDVSENGKTISSPWRTVKYACDYIRANIDTENQNTTIFIKTGMYREILPISVPKNCAIVGDELRSTTIMPEDGYETQNMFLVRNGSGIRNMTLQGLTGTLGEVNEYGTRRPSAGAYVSLDPGTGPTDESVWIDTKSPYVQNVTTFGVGCIGMKIDGALHNGGNRSIVANDFTQVLSDGIGYWADNAGRSELVSVFTYYCYIGYLSTNGGILRATNGNNSYGTFGSRAEGFNDSETPITAVINNRSKEAQINNVVTNGSNVLSLGYSHTGQSYSSASPQINGTGINIQATYNEFRDNAISQIRIIDPADSSVPGGLNYQTLLNNAQGGNSFTIILSAADTTGTLEKYEGMRVFIEAGKGVGQYGVITGYDPVSKIANISKEFDLSAGWEHVYPGYPIETTLDNTTRYRIEPRVKIDEPLFDATALEMGISGTWRHIVYGGNYWLAATNEEATNKISVSSSDGISWEGPENLTAGNNVIGVVYGGESAGLDTYYIGVTPSNGSSINYLQRYTIDTTDIGIRSLDTVSLGASSTWNDIASDGTNIIIAGPGTVSYGTGTSFVNTTIGTTQVWNCVEFGNGRAVLIEESGNGDVAYSDDFGANWTITSSAVTVKNWTDITYGNGRFVIVDDDNNAAYSFDGITWYDSIEGIHTGADILDKISYGGGVFLATGNSRFVSRSQDGLVWKNFSEDSTIYNLTTSAVFGKSAYNNGKWIVVASGNGLNWQNVFTGAKPFVRATVLSSRINNFVIYDPGSNYDSVPSVSIIDSENTVEVDFNVRLNNGVLAQPTFSNRGTGYTTATATVSGNGFADIYQTGNVIEISSLSSQPSPGANFVINGIDDKIFRVTEVSSISGSLGNFNASIKISPSIGNQESPDHEETVIIREQFSQIRLTGHDFLDIGTGNINSTRYPELYVFGQTSDNETKPENEVTEVAGGRVFYTSTDQDGNFRVGELFKVRQATGTVTISADFFDLQGLTEISLGGIVVGGSAVVIKEFSKEPTFVANSNNIVPTQRAIARYLESRISSGGSDAVTNTLVASQVRISGSTITTTSGFPIEVPVKAVHKGGTGGDYAALQYFGFGGKVN